MASKTDGNQKRIVRALRDIGASVQIIASMGRKGRGGRGCPDLLVGFRGVNYLMEVKDGEAPKSQQALTPAENTWHGEWRGQVCIIYNESEAYAAIGAGFQQG